MNTQVGSLIRPCFNAQPPLPAQLGWRTYQVRGFVGGLPVIQIGLFNPIAVRAWILSR